MKFKITNQGFTLVEILVVIVILSILGITGLTTFNNVTKNANDAKEKGDIEAIAKAYEAKYNPLSGYVALTGADFASGVIPSPAGGGSYFIDLVPNGGFRACSAIGSGTNPCSTKSATCFCKDSIQMAYSAGSPSPSPSAAASVAPSPSPSPSPSPTPPSYLAGLVAYWPMDESSWVNNCSATYSVIDTSGNSNNARSCPASGPSSVTGGGKAGNAGGLFDGVDDYLQTTTNIINPASTNFSVQAWVKPTSSTSELVIMSQQDSGGTGRNWLGIEGNTSKVFTYIGGGAGYNYGNTIASVGGGIGGWYHIVIVKNGTSVTFYLNGLSDGTVVRPAAESNSGLTRIGSTKAGASYFKGSIDDVAIWNRTLTAQEVTDLFNQGNAGLPLL